MSPITRPSQPDRSIRYIIILVVILAGGAYLRFHQVGMLPPGLYRDEAFYGLDALNILRGKFALFFAANNGREGLFIYLLSLGIALLGRTPEALRIVSASVGVATIAAMYAAGRQLFSPRIGLLSAGILAVTFWHVAISRVAFRAITLPLLLCIAVALWAASANGSSRHGKLLRILAGAAFGLTFYTYTSGQFIVLLVLVWVGWHGLMQRKTQQSPLANLRSSVENSAGYFIGAALALAPFALWLLRHADLYVARAGQVSILNPLINQGNLFGTLLDHIGKAALMFTAMGDRIWRHNLSLRPVFEGPLLLAFVIGLATCGWMLWQTLRRTVRTNTATRLHAHFLVLAWLIIFLVPTILAEDTPHFLRAIGALPAACLVAAVGLEAALGWLSRRGLLTVMGPIARRISPPALIATLIILYSGYRTYQDYFNDYVRQPLTGFWLEQQNVALANDINAWVMAHPQAPHDLWIQDRLSDDNAALRFLSSAIENNQIRSFHADTGALSMDEPTGLILLDPNHPWGNVRNALPKAPQTLQIREGALAKGDLDLKPRRAYIALEVQTPRVSDAKTITHTFGQGVVLSGHWLAVTSDSVQRPRLELRWQVLQAQVRDYSVFVHWRQAGKQIGQSDHSPALGYWPMPEWRLGDTFIDQHVFVLPVAPEAADEVRVGLYDPVTGQRELVQMPLSEAGQEWVIIPVPR